VGCGFGASSIFLVNSYRAQATEITISPVQVDMADAAAAKAEVSAEFLLMDAEAMKFEQERVDVVWSVESISHYEDTAKFFSSVARLLKPKGTLAITDWFMS
jgi:cyclopropane fatty-acyl-phospholipid synthase-like methyltransferase